MSRSLFVTDEVRDYVQHWGAREHPVLARCREDTQAMPNSSMQISPEQGGFMQAMVAALRARRALEVGVFTGYSSTAMALAMQAIHGDDAQLIGLDVSAEYTDRARAYWREAGVDTIAQLRLGPAAEHLRRLLAEGEADSFDLMFVDADKTGYAEYYELGLRLLRSGGMMLLDNMLWSGDVADPSKTEPDTNALRALAQHIHDDRRVDMTLATIGDGLSVVIKR